MELLPKDSLFEFNPDTIQYLRKQYDLDTPGRIEEAVQLLHDWIEKQPHFMKKDFARDYLERTIIICKGSVERAKVKLEKLCTFRTLYPHFFVTGDVKNFKSLTDLHGAFLPKLTEDHYRVFMFRNQAKVLENGFNEFYRYFFKQCEYLQAHDYCNGMVVCIDYQDAAIMEAVKALNVADLRQTLVVMKEGYGMRIKGLHFLSESKAMDIVLSIFKQVFSAKVFERIVVHKNVDTLHDFVPKDILPEDYGGKEKPLFELHQKYLNILSSKDFTDYTNEMNKARTDENLRQGDNDYCLGVTGTFRKLNVD
ncbi:alpha-tocopherol transfer protein-like [Vanessa atalanta]|uniref:alpha-tocopherol transfer protein-like n=1 Tax=Vanessa atalanta TaxID=42275 RepID=UPI001FCDE2E0|nr:alpha-tocopherol transfer protein-like [Vanessa atalanta]